MIKELRIGNLILDESGNQIEVMREHFDFLDFDECKPITLTDELLRRCKIKQLAMNKFKHIPTGLYLECAYELKYLHSIQNLYCAFTNEELIIQA